MAKKKPNAPPQVPVAMSTENPVPAFIEDDLAFPQKGNVPAPAGKVKLHLEVTYTASGAQLELLSSNGFEAKADCRFANTLDAYGHASILGRELLTLADKLKNWGRNEPHRLKAQQERLILR